jgi:peptidoglycan/xylan/chitin deacetylase (PgdA/CDA1 family)
MDRRKALAILGIGSAGLITHGFKIENKTKTHFITLSFDDGFEKSSIKTAEIYEKYGLSACINVIATAHLNQFKLPNEYHKNPVGDFDLWNELRSRGHEIMPHTYMHQNLTEIPLAEAQDLINKCFDVFSEKLEGFVTEESVYNFAYNASTPEIENWLSSKVRVFRTAGPAFNPFPDNNTKKLTCISYGPENIDKFLERTINEFLEGPSGWYIFNTHGLDDEGWGPVSSGYLDELLARLIKMKQVEVLPVIPVLDKAIK